MIIKKTICHSNDLKYNGGFMNNIVARELIGKPGKLAKQYFGTLISKEQHYDYLYLDVTLQNLIILGNFSFQVPALKELYKIDEL